jgi:hypothetical protein
MADRVSKYTIELEIEQADSTRQTINQVEKSLKSISDSTKNGLSDGLKEARKNAEKLASQIYDLATGEKDATQELEAYSRASARTLKDLEKQASTLTYSLSEQGKAQRANIEALKQELATLGQTKEELQRKKEIEKELKLLRKDVIEGTDEELQNALKMNKETRVALKLAQQEAKLSKAQIKEQKDLQKMGSQEVKDLSKKVEIQKKYNQELTKTKSRFETIKAVASKVWGGVKAVGKAGGALIGGAMALTGVARDAASFQQDRSREANRIRASLTPEQKESLLSDLYIHTGADAASIVDAINRVISVLGPSAKQDAILTATRAELQFPGAAAMFRQQNAGPVSANDFAIYQNRMKAVQGVTGSTQDQVLESTQKIANLKQKYFSNASMTELQSVYLGLQGSGAFDSQEELDRAFEAFVKAQTKSGQNVYDLLSTFDFRQYADTDTNRTQIENALKNISWSRLDAAAHSTNAEQTTSAADKTAASLRQMEEKRNKIMIKLMEVLEPLLEEFSKLLDSEKVQKIISGLVKFLAEVVPLMADVLAKIGDWIDHDQNLLNEMGKAAQAGDTKTLDNIAKDSLKKSNFGKAFGLDSFFANGGVATRPSICGEAGPELVVPMSYDRAARRDNLIAQFTQSFNMSGNQTTALSLASAVKSREFSRAMATNSFLNARLGR